MKVIPFGESFITEARINAKRINKAFRFEDCSDLLDKAF